MDDRDTLANLIDPNALELDAYPWPRDAADSVLASDWLAARDARVKAEALEGAEFSFTDEQWRAYQAIPEQGYSHRAHLAWLFNTWLRARAAEYRTGADELAT
jgi:hypothetical protein